MFELRFFVTLALATPALFAQSFQWRQLATSPDLGGSVSVYDHLRDRVVIFGGMSGHLPIGQLREFDGTTFVTPQVVSGPAPSGRASSSLVFDSRRGEVVIFGGYTVNTGNRGANDLWEWNGVRFRQTSPIVSPPPRLSESLTYDEARGRVVLFGGMVQVSGGSWIAFDDTWEWDGVNWQQMQPTTRPSARAGAVFLYDPTQSRCLLFSRLAADAWSWDGAQWQQLPAAAVAPTDAVEASAFDRERGRIVRLVWSPGVPTPVMYQFDGVAWTAGPPLSGGPAIPVETVYDRQRGRFIGIGFAPYTLEAWALELPDLAVAQPYGNGCGSPALVAKEDAGARPLLGSTLGVDVENVPGSMAFMCFGWSNEQVLSLSLPYPMEAWGLPGCWLLQSDDAITLPVAITGPGTGRYSLAIPADPSFTGLRCFLQPWAPAPGPNPAGATVGNGIAVTIGSR